MADKEIAVKKYVVKLTDGEREQLSSLIRSLSPPLISLTSAWRKERIRKG